MKSALPWDCPVSQIWLYPDMASRHSIQAPIKSKFKSSQPAKQLLDGKNPMIKSVDSFLDCHSNSVHGDF